MSFLRVTDITKSFTEEKELLKGVSFTVSDGAVLGIIGRNGEGKTTLLKIIAGVLKPDAGSVTLSEDNPKIGYHTQFLPVDDDSDITIEEYIVENFPEVRPLYEKINQLAMRSDEESIEQLIQCQGEFDDKGGYLILGAIDHALVELGLSQFKATDMVRVLSGGQKTRLQLAKVVIHDPEILLLDEPTNHLDADTIQWLESYIKRRSGITAIVSHDRTFLNEVTNHILEIEKGKWKLYFGNYSEYIEEKARLEAHAMEVIKQNKKKIVQLKAAASAKVSQAIMQSSRPADRKKYGRHSKTIMGNKAGKKMRQVKMMTKRITENLEENRTIHPTVYRNMGFKVEAVESIGDFALRITDLHLRIGGKELLNDASMEILKGERVALRGANGTGKTTLVKEILEAQETDAPQIKFGGGIFIGYYSQEHEEIDLGLTVIDDFRKGIPITEADAASYLYRMAFERKHVFQKTSELSQGEKTKLALSKLLYHKHNFLILDEPTNHLDIKSREILEEALEDYTGTILVISHDKYFLDKIQVTKTYTIKDQKLIKE